jgi:hypothetical protein
LVYRAIAEHAVQRAAWVLRWRAEPPEPARILELLSSPAARAAAIRQAMPPNDAMAERWLVELDSPSPTIHQAFQTFGERLGTLLDWPAGRSLGAVLAEEVHDLKPIDDRDTPCKRLRPGLPGPPAGRASAARAPGTR